MKKNKITVLSETNVDITKAGIVFNEVNDLSLTDRLLKGPGIPNTIIGVSPSNEDAINAIVSQVKEKHGTH